MKIINHDINREKRCGVPEIIYGEGKTEADLAVVVTEFLRDAGRAIITRIDEDKAKKIIEATDKKRYIINHNKKGRVLVVKKKNKKTKTLETVGILCAGTSDTKIAEEARAIAEELGCKVLCEYDVGIAGIHRVFPAIKRLRKAKVYIVAAGMEGALPSVVAGLVKAPVIAVPTSVGYGTSEKGKTALNTMLNSCTPLAVVNIDNGYGAAIIAYKIITTQKNKK
jgi:pyridinium-3,5-biscarboxylic acid mononucleotide synthase